MDYLVTLDNARETLVRLREPRRGLWEARLTCGTTMEMELRGRADDGDFLVLVDGHLRRFELRDHGQGQVLLERSRDSQHTLSVVHAAEAVLSQSTLNAPADRDDELRQNTIASPITGIVLDVIVTPNQTLRAGDPVVIVEAMKMENTFRAPRAGRVSEICVQAGQTIFVHDALVRLN